MGEHSYCQDWWCDFGAQWRPRVVALGLTRATAERPYVVVSLDPSTPDGLGLAVGSAYADHRQGKPARTRAGGGFVHGVGWAH